MKFGFTLKDIKVGDKATVGEITVNMQYDAKELVEEYGLIRKIIREIPETVADLGAGAVAFEQMDKAFDGMSDYRRTEFSNEEIEEGEKQSAINNIMAVVNSLRSVVPNDANKSEEQTA